MTLALRAFGLQQVSTPAWPRNTLPVAVILKRFATAFFVLRLDIGFGIGSREPILLNQVRNRKLRKVRLVARRPRNAKNWVSPNALTSLIRDSVIRR